MPKILCTMPGRHGDILWALPTMRALSEAYGTPVSLHLSAQYGSLAPLLRAQPYLDQVVVDPAWQVQETAPMTPRTPPAWREDDDDRVYHLGYEGWPEGTLATDIYNRAYQQLAMKVQNALLPGLDLDRPWITRNGPIPCLDPPYIWVGWSEEWFELKVGLLALVAARFPDQTFWWLRPWQGRYDEVDVTTLPQTGTHTQRLGPNIGIIRAHWPETALLGQGAACYLGCLSSQWVLANALGMRCVVVEPAEARGHPVFWRESARNVLVRGNDGRPTFDARHVGDVLEGVLKWT